VLTILKSERFQKEYKEFSEQIEAITNDVFKSEMTSLLGKLVNEVRAIDAQSQEFMLGQKPVQSSIETRNTVSEIRSRIIQKLSDYKEANPN
jgi:FMN-dependent NADH-azoreductase